MAAKRSLRAGLAAAGLAAAAVPAFAYSHGWWHDGSGGWLGMLIGPLIMIFWIALAVAVVLFILRLFGIGGRRRDGETPTAQPPGETPLDILKRRYAAGEIDAQTFDSMKARLARE